MSFNENLLGIFVTDKCNKMCEYCIYDVKNNSYPFNEDIYKTILERMDCSRYDVVVLSGGEPLMYPNINKFVEGLFNDFPKAVVKMRTNGRLLHSYEWLGNSRTITQISQYPGWNDEIISEFVHTKNVEIIPFKGFVDLKNITGISDTEVDIIYNNCERFLWVKGGRVYECCGSIIPERRYGFKDISVPIEEWDSDSRSLFKTKRACKLCLLGTEDYKKAKKSLKYRKGVQHW